MSEVTATADQICKLNRAIGNNILIKDGVQYILGNLAKINLQGIREDCLTRLQGILNSASLLPHLRVSALIQVFRASEKVENREDAEMAIGSLDPYHQVLSYLELAQITDDDVYFPHALNAFRAIEDHHLHRIIAAKALALAMNDLTLLKAVKASTPYTKCLVMLGLPNPSPRAIRILIPDIGSWMGKAEIHIALFGHTGAAEDIEPVRHIIDTTFDQDEAIKMLTQWYSLSPQDNFCLLEEAKGRLASNLPFDKTKALIYLLRAT